MRLKREEKRRVSLGDSFVGFAENMNGKLALGYKQNFRARMDMKKHFTFLNVAKRLGVLLCGK
jgi:hypothetical protein